MKPFNFKNIHLFANILIFVLLISFARCGVSNEEINYQLNIQDSAIKSLELRVTLLEDAKKVPEINDTIRKIPSCTGAKFTFPKGADNEGDASLFPSKKRIKVQWTPAKCKMDFQYYQGTVCIETFKNVQSGFEIVIKKPGVTELKIWNSGLIADDIWIEVKK